MYDIVLKDNYQEQLQQDYWLLSNIEHVKTRKASVWDVKHLIVVSHAELSYFLRL